MGKNFIVNVLRLGLGFKQILEQLKYLEVNRQFDVLSVLYNWH